MRHAQELMAMGIECYRVQFPKGMDANEYALKVQPAAKSLGIMLNRAVWLGKGERSIVAVIEPVEIEPLPPPEPEPQIEEQHQPIAEPPATPVIEEQSEEITEEKINFTAKEKMHSHCHSCRLPWSWRKFFL